MTHSTRNHARRSLPTWPLVGLAVVGAPLLLLGQYAVTRTPAVGQVNPQVNTELYGRGTSNGSVRYTPANTSRALDSEVRYAAWINGATPSSVRTTYGKIGPMAPGGPMAYIPSAPTYNPNINTAPPSAMGSAAYSNASVRYSSPHSSHEQASMVSSPQLSSALVSSGPITCGPTLRYTP